MNIFGSMKLWIFFGGITKLDNVGVIYIHFRAFR